MTHSAECTRRLEAMKAFEAKYPKYCRSCGGTGSWYDPGVRYHSDGSGTPPDGGPCVCIEEGHCPLCAGALLLQTQIANGIAGDYSRCIVCGWDEWKIMQGKAQAESLPEVDCYCYEERSI